MAEWQGCPAVNPWCPDDLCTLEPGHHKHMHRTGTMSAPARWPLPMMKRGTPMAELMAEGRRRPIDDLRQARSTA